MASGGYLYIVWARKLLYNLPSEAMFLQKMPFAGQMTGQLTYQLAGKSVEISTFTITTS